MTCSRPLAADVTYGGAHSVLSSPRSKHHIGVVWPGGGEAPGLAVAGATKTCAGPHIPRWRPSSNGVPRGTAANAHTTAAHPAIHTSREEFFFSSAFVTWELHGIKLRFFFYPCVAVMMEPDAYSTCRPSRSGAARDHVQFRKLLLYSVYTPPIHYTYSDSVHCCHTNAGTTHINSV